MDSLQKDVAHVSFNHLVDLNDSIMTSFNTATSQVNHILECYGHQSTESDEIHFAEVGRCLKLFDVINKLPPSEMFVKYENFLEKLTDVLHYSSFYSQKKGIKDPPGNCVHICIGIKNFSLTFQTQQTLIH